MEFLYCVWAFNKNYEQKLEYYDVDADSESDFESEVDDDSDDKPIKQPEKYHTYTFDQLFKLILQYCPDTYLPKIRCIAAYGIQTSENFIMSLLLNRQDAIASDNKFLKQYSNDLDEQLFIFAIRNQNEQFLRYALFNSLIGADLFLSENVRKEILDQL